MFNTKFAISISIFVALLIVTSAIKNKSRVFEKKITKLNTNIQLKKEFINEAQLDFFLFILTC